MREYLLDFFKEFDYDEADARDLLCAYDRIMSSEAAGLLCEAVSEYEANIKLDYQTKILDRSKEISKLAGLHPYTVDLLVFICMTRHLATVYQHRGIDMQIYRDSILDLKWKVEECRAVKGICGSFVAPWFPGFFELTRFALGRLQFEIVTMPYDYERVGIVLKANESRVINVHIPRTHTPIDRQSCDKSYEMAREFFKDQLGEFPVFVCASWLLFPENKSILPPHSNVYRFMSEYDIVDWGYNNGEDLWRLFDTEETDPEKLPTDSTLRRCYAEHLRRGGRVGWGAGVKL